MQECIEILVPGETFRITTSDGDAVVDGQTFHPTAAALATGFGGELVLTLPADHAFAVRYLAGGVPRKQTIINWVRIDEDGAVILRWKGEIAAAEFDHREVRLRIMSVLTRALKHRLPAVFVSRTCQHRIFDSGCRLDRCNFTKSGLVLAINQYDLTLDIALPSKWACGGELVHVPSGERCEIVGQCCANDSTSRTIITLQARLYSVRIGDLVEVSAGCDHHISTCRDKFDNVVNFGGHPHLPNTSVDQ